MPVKRVLLPFFPEPCPMGTTSSSGGYPVPAWPIRTCIQSATSSGSAASALSQSGLVANRSKSQPAIFVMSRLGSCRSRLPVRRSTTPLGQLRRSGCASKSAVSRSTMPAARSPIALSLDREQTLNQACSILARASATFLSPALRASATFFPAAS
jgi:hypothetical protein